MEEQVAALQAKIEVSRVVCWEGWLVGGVRVGLGCGGGGGKTEEA